MFTVLESTSTSESNFNDISTQTNNHEDELLKDALEAYTCQNTFLNKEILELNLLRRQASDREQKLIA